MLRWLRLLFAREYILAQIGFVWDMLFASAAGGERGSPPMTPNLRYVPKTV